MSLSSQQWTTLQALACLRDRPATELLRIAFDEFLERLAVHERGSIAAVVALRTAAHDEAEEGADER